MARRAFRILLILALAALAGVTGWQVWSLDRTRTQQRADAEGLQRDALRVTQAILDLRASQRAYLSPGQGIGAWKPRVDAHIVALREQFTELREQAAASSSPTAAAVAQADDEALDALVATRYLEQRISDHVNAGRLQHAADLVYADGIRASLVLERAANAAFVAHAQELQAGRTRVQWVEGVLLGLAAAIGFVLGMLVMPSKTGQAAEAGADAAEGAERSPRATGAAGAAGDAAAAGAATGRTATAGRRAEPAVQGHGLAGGRPATGGAAATATIAGAAARAGSKPTGATRHTPMPASTPAIAASGRTAPAAAPPAVTMADDLPLHAPAPTFSSAAVQSAHAAGAPGGGTAAALAAGSASSPASSSGSTPAASGSASSAAAAVVSRSVGSQTDDGMLTAAADLTAAVARVGDLDGLKPVMARLADHLDAVGLIVWLEDASTQRLTPIVTHGYPAETLAHLHPIDLDADNATARAWREAELQVVPGRNTTPGAIVVPMPSSAGCVGVIAAEVRHGREHDTATLALARILAAQLAMLTGSRG